MPKGKRRYQRIQEHREHLAEGLMDFLKPSPRGVARIKARRHEHLANKLAEKPGREVYKHINAARRYQRVADGKKPFGGE